MGEKAECPRCKSYVSQVYYDARHDWCGWGHGIRTYVIRLAAAGRRDDEDYGKLAEMKVGFERPLTDDQIRAVRSAFAQALQDAWGDTGEPDYSIYSIHINVSGMPPDWERVKDSPWWFTTVADAQAWLDAHPPKGDKWTHANTARAHWRRIAKFYGLDQPNSPAFRGKDGG